MTKVLNLGPPDVVLAASALVGEGPVVDSRTGRLCWVDIPAGLLHESDLAARCTTTSDVGMQLGAIAPRASQSGFAAAVFDGFALWSDDKLDVVDPVLTHPERRMNDAKCDSAGRLWAGSTHTSYLPGYGQLHRWDGLAPSEVMASGFVLPNGIGWSPDDRLMYVNDSFADVLMVADFDAADGAIGGLAVLTAFHGGHPDGLAVDVDGGIWIAVWGASEVRRYSPRGELLARVPMPVTQPSSCAFGGVDTLYITSAADTLSESDLAREPLAGSIFATSVGVAGLPVEPFAR